MRTGIDVRIPWKLCCTWTVLNDALAWVVMVTAWGCSGDSAFVLSSRETSAVVTTGVFDFWLQKWNVHVLYWRLSLKTREPTTVEPGFNKPLYSEVLGIMNDISQPSNSVIYWREPQYNQPISPVPWHFVKLRFHCNRFNHLSVNHWLKSKKKTLLSTQSKKPAGLVRDLAQISLATPLEEYHVYLFVWFVSAQHQ